MPEVWFELASTRDFTNVQYRPVEQEVEKHVTFEVHLLFQLGFQAKI
jgi:hypothetical protein